MNKRTVITLVCIGLMALLLALALVGCGNTEQTKKPADSEKATDVQKESEKPADTEKPETPEKEWGKRFFDKVYKNNVNVDFQISFPDMLGASYGSTFLAEQLDGSIALVANERANKAVVDSIDSLYPEYFAELKTALSELYVIGRDDSSFKISDKSTKTVNGKEMAVYSGDVTIKNILWKEDKVCHWVSYAVKLEKNDAVAYWAVIDATDNNSLGDKIYETAQKMAESFKELPD